MILVIRASDDYWFDFETETNIIKLYKKYGSIIIESNDWEGEDPIELVQFWENLSLEDAQKIAKCKYRILIYDDYIE